MLILLLAPSFLWASPYGIIAYAEGGSFARIRDGVTEVFNSSDGAVFGMEVRPGDMYQTRSGCFLELAIYPGAASVQIAENTSFKCDQDISASKPGGELYYGRVWPKGGESFFYRQNLPLVRGMSSLLITVGTISCVAASGWYTEKDPDARFIDPAYSAGLIMIGSGTVLTLLSLFAD